VKSFSVAWDLLIEARSRTWFLGLFIALTLLLLVLALGLKLDVVDGALAAAHLFGHGGGVGTIRSVDVALRPVFEAGSLAIFYGGLLFGIFACADFGPKLLAPGRIEHMLSLPVRRWELLAGTLLGVSILALLATLYGAGGLTLIFGVKAGFWTIRPILSGLLAAAAFVTVYAAMLASATFARSAPVSSGVGLLIFALGIGASERATLLPMFSPGFGRWTFDALTIGMPRIARLGELSGKLAGSAPVPAAAVLTLLGGFLAFGAAVFALGLWRFEGKDY
jgi:Cu-processing system permease protein